MNEEPQETEPPMSNTTSPPSQQLTINQAADAIGVDVFTMLSLIQRGKVNPTRSPSGEIIVPEGELAKLTGKGR
jgi:predicted site-specific integrase-resolvase